MASFRANRQANIGGLGLLSAKLKIWLGKSLGLFCQGRKEFASHPYRPKTTLWSVKD
jgi:hypothetical protein